MDWLLGISIALTFLAIGVALGIWLSGGPAAEPPAPGPRGEDDSDPGYSFAPGRFPLH